MNAKRVIKQTIAQQQRLQLPPVLNYMGHFSKAITQWHSRGAAGQLDYLKGKKQVSEP